MKINRLYGIVRYYCSDVSDSVRVSAVDVTLYTGKGTGSGGGGGGAVAKEKVGVSVPVVF